MYKGETHAQALNHKASKKKIKKLICNFCENVFPVSMIRETYKITINLDIIIFLQLWFFRYTHDLRKMFPVFRVFTRVTWEKSKTYL
ncbi:hypothetical protein BK771_32630 [Bacillus thuringiensis serovar ostriniae]|uniref:Uncharacterized protein n=1 Tax=Bacillus wiedmannii TaxID=1890302 RepID=A0A242Z002_9BACI|nr:hypothetical protein BK730_23845 [Bacillus wiedmannii]OTZ80615.1 hypothetical protein BK771_32630 [Bacillus thuringiensis serovar ostriniae]